MIAHNQFIQMTLKKMLTCCKENLAEKQTCTSHTMGPIDEKISMYVTLASLNATT